MNEKDPIEKLFEEIGSLLQFIEKNLHNVPSAEELPADINQKLDAIEKRVEALNRVSEDIVRSVDVSNEEMKMRLMGLSQNLPQKDKNIVAKGESIKTNVGELEKLYKEIDKARSTDLELPPSSAPAASSQREPVVDAANIEELMKSDKKGQISAEGKKRKSKFKRFGGNDKWKPL